MSSEERWYKLLGNLTSDSRKALSNILCDSRITNNETRLELAEQSVKTIVANKTIVSKKIDPEAIEVAEKLKYNVINRYPTDKADVRVHKWAEDIQIIHNKHNWFSYGVISLALDWIEEGYQPTGFCWAKNIRSGAKLKKHWNQIFTEMQDQYSEQELAEA